MPRPRRLALLALLGLAALLLGACGESKAYFFPEVRIDATLHADGSLSIVEERTFDFTGSFSFAFFTVEHKQFDDVVEFRVAEGDDVYEQGAAEVPGHVVFEDDVLDGPGGFKFKATWWFQAQDERRTWTISYRVLCAADVYSDTAHLLWKFVGEGWTERTEHAVITLHLPDAVDAPAEPRPEWPCSPGSLLSDNGGLPPAARDLAGRPLRQGETLAFGHGPLQGNVSLPDPSTVVLDIRDLPPSTFVEGSVVFPESAVPLAYQGGLPGREEILAEEDALRVESDRLRREAIALENRRRRVRTFGWGFLAAWPALGLSAAAWMLLRDRAPGIPRVLSEPPEPAMRPARLALEWGNWRRKLAHANAFRAQLLTLAQQGSVEIRPLGRVSDSQDYELVPRRPPPDELDRRFYDALFAGDAPINTSEFKPSSRQLNELGDWWDAIIKAAKASGTRLRKLFLPFGLIPFTLPFWATGVAIYSGLPWWWVVLAFAVTVATLIVMRRLVPVRYLSEERRGRLQRWNAFRRYLKDFSNLPQAPTAAIVVWERYLSLATALGVADLVEKQVRALVPEVQLRSPWAGAAATATPPPALSSMIGSLATRSLTQSDTYRISHASSSSSGSSSSFSSSGFGGGFSSGGGGGGGGTGGGAG